MREGVPSPRSEAQARVGVRGELAPGAEAGAMRAALAAQRTAPAAMHVASAGWWLGSVLAVSADTFWATTETATERLAVITSLREATVQDRCCARN